MSPESKGMMPTLFIPHGGGPCFFMDYEPPDTWSKMARFLRELASTLPQRPRAILVISGHWAENPVTVNNAAQPSMLFDYYGFPKHTYELKYPAPGDPQLASHVRELLEQAHIPSAEDAQRGYDHGVFVPLMLVFPEADIPIVQLSLRSDLDPEAHYALGQALAPLREEGVLILGSGMSFHNMRGYRNPRFGPISDTFDAWLGAAVEAEPERRHQALVDWVKAPAAELSHPPGASEHLVPLFVAAGAAHAGRGRRIFSDRVLETTVSAFRFD